MPDAIRMGSVLIKQGTPLPENLLVESEMYIAGWRLIKNLDARGLDKRIQEAGWTFFRLAGEMNVTVFGLDQEKTVRKAVEQILAKLTLGEVNSVEITRAASSASKRFLGVTYLSVSARSGYIQECLTLAPQTDFQIKENPRLSFLGPVEGEPGTVEIQSHGETIKNCTAMVASS